MMFLLVRWVIGLLNLLNSMAVFSVSLYRAFKFYSIERNKCCQKWKRAIASVCAGAATESR